MLRKTVGNLFGLILILMCCRAAFAENRYALVIGINDYPSSRKLDGSVRDATRLADFFIQNKFTQVRLLTDKQAVRKDIFDGFAYFQNKVEPGDIFYFYFAGHGTVFPDSRSDDRDEFLTIRSGINPSTGKPFFPEGKYDSAICPFDHKSNTSGKRWGNIILDDELFEEFSKFAGKGSLSVLISDSCHSGTLGRNLENRNYRFLLPEEAYDQTEDENISTDQSRPKILKITTAANRIEQMKGKYVALTAAGDNQLSEEIYFDSVNGEMGIFTYYLLEILREKPDITFSDLVPELNKRISKKNGQQTVQLEKRYLNAGFNNMQLLNP